MQVTMPVVDELLNDSPWFLLHGTRVCVHGDGIDEVAPSCHVFGEEHIPLTFA